MNDLRKGSITKTVVIPLENTNQCYAYYMDEQSLQVVNAIASRTFLMGGHMRCLAYT